ncbi:MAG: hypothetical protein KAQ71_07480, partial [Desulfobulbaceae bacterium]|nr:hypothetical protein [Desulfobulbaceae bacterium]
MKRYFTALNILFIVAAVYFCVKAFYKVATASLDHASSPKATTRRVVSPEDTTIHPMSYYRAIIDRNLFNTKKGTGR